MEAEIIEKVLPTNYVRDLTKITIKCIQSTGYNKRTRSHWPPYFLFKVLNFIFSEKFANELVFSFSKSSKYNLL